MPPKGYYKRKREQEEAKQRAAVVNHIANVKYLGKYSKDEHTRLLNTKHDLILQVAMKPVHELN